MTDPIERPKIRIGDKEYSLKFRLTDVIALERDGIFLRDISQHTFSIEKLLRFVLAGVAHEAILDFDTVAASLELSDVSAIADAVKRAMEKAQPPAQAALREPAAPLN
jgi:hypothetical protein